MDFKMVLSLIYLQIKSELLSIFLNKIYNNYKKLIMLLVT